VIDWLMLLLLLVAVLLGYWFGWRARAHVVSAPDVGIQAHYIRGLNYLLNEQQDAAIDTFMEALEVNAETLETHLALGNLLRKRGEVGRAIKIHQNLLARPGLSVEHAQQVQLELARDYVSSGLLDRAETLLQELVEDVPPALRVICLEYLIGIYRDEKEWLKAIAAVNQLASRRFSRLPEPWRVMQGHFYCELAAAALARADYLVARRHLRSALVSDKQSARSNLLLAELERELGRHAEAVRALKQVPQQNPFYVSEALPMLYESHKALATLPSLSRYLRGLLEQSPQSSVVLMLAELVAQEDGERAAVSFIAEHMERAPTLRGVGQMLSLQLSDAAQTTGVVSEGILAADSLIRGLQQQAPHYRCKACGFSGKQMHWLCPSCKHWGSVRSID